MVRTASRHAEPRGSSVSLPAPSSKPAWVHGFAGRVHIGLQAGCMGLQAGCIGLHGGCIELQVV